MPPESFNLHPYETLQLQPVGLVVGVLLLLLHGWMWLKPEQSMELCRKLPRNQTAGQIVMGLGLAWFWLLIAPDGLGKLGSLSFEMSEFAFAKKLLQFCVPLCYVLLVMYVKEFLFVRGLGVLLLMAAAPILYAAFLKEPDSRLLLPVVAYAMIIKGMFYIGQPYLFRDGVTVLSASRGRWRLASGFGALYGAAVIAAALVDWA